MSTTANALKAKPAAAPEKSKPGDEPPKKSKKKLIIIVLVLVLLVGGYEAKSMLFKTVYKPGQKVPDGKIFPLDQLTITLSDGHQLQVTPALQLTAVATSSTISSDMPKFDDDANTVFGTMSYKQLLDPSGKETARKQLLADFQKMVGTVDGAAQQISAVYFQTWTMQ